MSVPKTLDTLQRALRGFRARVGLGRDAREALFDALRALGGEIEALRQQNAALQAKLAARPGESAVDGELFDAFYMRFENRCRGSSEEVREKTAFYLGELESLGLDKSTAVILDLGCGRGEWLELLREAGYRRACGIDSSQRMIDLCREKDLHAATGDAIDRLEIAEAESLSSISGYHIAEHLTFHDLLRLLRAAFRALKPGGLAIFETPNPRNILVGGNTFHLDPTHLKPIPVELFSCAGESAGFQVKAIHQRSPHPHLLKMAETVPDEAKLFKYTLTCGLDYGIVLQKPA